MEWKRQQWMAKIKRLMLSKEQRRRRALEEAEFWENWQNNTAAANYIEPSQRQFYTAEEVREVAGFYTIGPGAKMDKRLGAAEESQKRFQDVAGR